MKLVEVCHLGILRIPISAYPQLITRGKRTHDAIDAIDAISCVATPVRQDVRREPESSVRSDAAGGRRHDVADSLPRRHGRHVRSSHAGKLCFSTACYKI